jgi:RNA polymerase sigma-70 factor (ECF subfamily)
MVASPEDVDDLVQDTFVLAYSSLGRFRGESSFSTWLYTIAVNTTIKHLRKARARQTVSIDDPDARLDTSAMVGAEPGPGVCAENGERREAVRRAVESLPERHRMVVVLHYFEDYSCEEIARIMRCSVGTVWSRLHYACRKLRGQLGWLESA